MHRKGSADELNYSFAGFVVVYSIQEEDPGLSDQLGYTPSSSAASLGYIGRPRFK